MQLDVFDLLYEKFYLPSDRPVRLVEMFAGIGTQRMGFERAGIEVDVIAIVEVDKDAVKSYAAMHTDYLELREYWFNENEVSKEYMIETLQAKMLGYDFKNGKHTISDRTNIERVRDYYLSDLLSKNLGDISKVKGADLPVSIDMLTYSFPCTDLSKAGQQKGLEDTRSGLVYEVFRIVQELKNIGNKPNTLVMENVIDLVQSKFIKEFQEMQLDVERFGYENYVLRMNAKDYGVAQNRDRVFMVSIPKEHNYTEPRSFVLEKRLKDYLEETVDDKYYLNDSQIKSMENPIFESMGIDRVNKPDGLSNALTTMGGGNREPKVIVDEPICLNSKVNGKQPSIQDRIYSSEGTSTAITTSFHPNIQEPSICASRGRNPENTKSRKSGLPTTQHLEINSSGLSNTLTTVQKDNYVIEPAIYQNGRGFNKGGKHDLSPTISSNSWQENNHLLENADGIYKNASKKFDKGSLDGLSRCLKSENHDAGVVENKSRIRKLTPLECWRLMGINDDYFDRATQVNSNSQLYKQAGNAIVVDVFGLIVKQMYKGETK